MALESLSLPKRGRGLGWKINGQNLKQKMYLFYTAMLTIALFLNKILTSEH